ncbi:MAG TPA: RNA polymerase sigma factor [Candidatus Aminicenantes bacterium]|nr:RNA polymerase sigma factor [Candidatus Aminicenantes bacterium]
MDLQDALTAGRFFDEVSLSVKKIVFASFPGLTEEEREEIDQDVKLKLLKMAARGKKIANPRSYIWKMVYSTALDIITRRSRALCLDDVVKTQRTALAAHVDTLSPEHLFEEKELLSLVEASIVALPPRRQTAVLLHLQGLGLEEIATYIGESLNAARHLLYRGLDAVKQELEAAYGKARRDRERAKEPGPRLEWKRT